MANTAAAMLQVVRSDLGYQATSIWSKFNKWYGMAGYWCGMSVSMWAVLSGNGDIIPRFAFTPTGAAWFKARGQWHPGIKGLYPGCLVFFSFGGKRIDHVGVFEGFWRGKIVTLDGNTSSVGGRSGGCVARRARNIKYVVGYGAPAYIDAPTRATSTPTQLIVDGIIGPASVKALQKVMGTPIDGIITGQYRPNRKYLAAWKAINWGTGGSPAIRQLQAWAGAARDGILGPASVKAIQKMNAVTPDGYFGPISARAFQRWLNYHLKEG